MSEPTIVAVTEPEYDKGRTVFERDAHVRCVRAPIEEESLAAAIRDEQAAHVVLGVEAYAGPLYDAVPKGGVLARFGVGYDGLQLELATQRGLLCTNTPGVLDQSVAEHAIALMLAAARQVPRLHRMTQSGIWRPALGVELGDKRLAVIGCGRIGCRVARIAAVGFGMDVIGVEPREVDTDAMKREFGFTAVLKEFDAGVSDADMVSLHISSTPATKHFINAERLACMNAKAWLINTARGAVVDELALFGALRDGAIGGAALDVFAAEPYKPADPALDLRALANVIMTPHVGSSTLEACERMAKRALRNLDLAVAGRYEDMDLLNPEVLNK